MGTILGTNEMGAHKRFDAVAFLLDLLDTTVAQPSQMLSEVKPATPPCDREPDAAAHKTPCFGSPAEHLDAKPQCDHERLWYIELIEHLAALTAQPDEPVGQTDARVHALMNEYMEKQMHDGWTLECCVRDIRARIRQATNRQDGT